MSTQPADDALDPAQSLELAAAAVVNELPIGGEKQTYAIVRAGLSLNDLVVDHGAVVHVHRIGGLIRGWQVAARVSVDVYAADYTDAWAAQNAVEAAVGGSWRPNTTPGGPGVRIDSWRNESAPIQQPYPGLSVITSIWRVTTRHMPA